MRKGFIVPTLTLAGLFVAGAYLGWIAADWPLNFPLAFLGAFLGSAVWFSLMLASDRWEEYKR